MIFEHYPRGHVDYRKLNVTRHCDWEKYPKYIPEEPLWQQPFSVNIPGGICLGDHIFTPDGRLVTFDPPIYDQWTLERTSKTLERFRPSEVEHIPGTIVTFNTSFGDSYGHWISEVIPCFSIAWNLDVDDYNFYLNLGRTDNHFKPDTLEWMGFNLQRLVQPEYFPCVTPCFTCDEIIDSQIHPVVSADNVIFIRKTRYSWWARDFVSRTFRKMAEPRRKNRRLYFSRSEEQRRKIINEPEVIEVLMEYGFEIIQKDDFWMPYAEQVGMFREAEIVVTQRASIFYNLWYCDEGFHLITLWARNENHYPGIVNKFQNVINIECEPKPCSDFPDDRNCDDIMVDIAELRQSVESAIHQTAEMPLSLEAH